ncbi:MAG: elongation factor P [Helicobacteraceae bacterium]|jgi:elongation factor P|nr:elongation factor P [Helicobacteraceae bacterium]
MTYAMGDLKKGLKIELDGVPYKIVEYQHVKPGKGPAFVRTKIKSLLDGRVIENTFHAGDKAEKPDLTEATMQYLYKDGEHFQFMDTSSYEQYAFNADQVGDAANWLIENVEVSVSFHNGKPIGVEPPQTVALKVVQTPPNFKGDTSAGSKKPAKLETGVIVQVPYHVLEGETIRVDTFSGEYIEKVK